MKKIKQLKGEYTVVTILLIIFMIGIVYVYYQSHTVSYASLDYAIQKTTNGGQVLAKYDFDKGVFTFIKNSRKKYDYYYLINKRWYNKGRIRETKYKIEKEYTVTIYYVPVNKITFIRVDSYHELSNIKDSIDTEFQQLITKDGDSFFFGGTFKEIPDDYTIYLDDNKYLLKEYNGLFEMYS